jgi:hypothetical protein
VARRPAEEEAAGMNQNPKTVIRTLPCERHLASYGSDQCNECVRALVYSARIALACEHPGHGLCGACVNDLSKVLSTFHEVNPEDEP